MEMQILGHTKDDYKINATRVFRELQRIQPDQFEECARRIIDAVRKWKEDADEEWLIQLFFPEYRSGVRIPGAIPFPTCMFNEKFTILYSPAAANTSGVVQFNWDPTEFYNTWAGPNTIENGVAGNVVMSSLFSMATFYRQARVTGACMVVSYVGSIDNCKGYINSCLDMEKSAQTGNTTNNYVAAMMPISSYENAYFNYSGPLGAGAKVVWLPRDYNDLNFSQFYSTTFTGKGVLLSVRCDGVPTGVGTVLKVECYRSIECIASAQYTPILQQQTCGNGGGNTTPSANMSKVSEVVNKVGKEIITSNASKTLASDVFDFLNDIGANYVTNASNLILDAVSGFAHGLFGGGIGAKSLGPMELSNVMGKMGLFKTLFGVI